MPPEIVVFAVGNRSRGDDAIGPVLLERLAAALAARAQTDRFALIEDYQLQIEHALDLQGRRLALFIDAGRGTAPPLEFYAVEPAPAAVLGGTHALPPEGVLAVYRQAALGAPPPAFVLCVRGEAFELGASLSRTAEAHLEAAWRRLVRLCARPEAQLWRAIASASRGQTKFAAERCAGTERALAARPRRLSRGVRGRINVPRRRSRTA